MATKHAPGSKKGRSWLDMWDCSCSSRSGKGRWGEVCRRSAGMRRRRRRKAALGGPAQGVDSYGHGAGKHHAERWSCFNEKMLL